jgi:hypothetical protein
MPLIGGLLRGKRLYRGVLRRLPFVVFQLEEGQDVVHVLLLGPIRRLPRPAMQMVDGYATDGSPLGVCSEPFPASSRPSLSTPLSRAIAR